MSSIDIREEAGVRTLHFGSEWIQGAMRIARPWQLELDYTREMMACLLLKDDAHFPAKALQIGLGAASLTKFVFRYCPQTKLTVVEINPAVVAAARQFFKLPDEDPKRLRLVIDDGAAFMAKTNSTYDLILLDAYDADAKAGELDTLPFYQLCNAHLKKGGILVANLFGRSSKRSGERIRQAFNGHAITLPSCDSGNVIAFAVANETVSLDLTDLRQRAVALKKATGLNLLPTLSRLEGANCCREGKLKIE
jgi:spermidine synthase